MATYDKLEKKCKTIGFNNLSKILRETVTFAEKNELTHFEFLDHIMGREIEIRNERRIKMNMKKAKFPSIKTIEEFDFKVQTTITKRDIRRLEDFSWIDNRENIVFYGPSGVGKSHLSTGLGIKAINEGYKVKMQTSQELLEYLDLGYQQEKLKEKIKALMKFDVLIIDELGYLPLDKRNVYNFFQLINSVYENCSIILTSNKNFSEWGEFFTDESAATAIIDRIIHHCHIFALGGESYRLKTQKLKKE
jgi:DNA replication protein DnaC